MAISKITTTPTPLSVVDKINEVIDGKLDTTAKAASATTADSATTAGTCTGNAASASKAAQLTTARTIDGVSFNGTAAITHYGTCSTAAATADKTVSLTGFSLVTGARVLVKFTVTNTAANPTLNVNSTGAKAIMYRGSAISAGYLAANRVYEFVYDGTDYEFIGDYNTNTTYSAATTSAAGLMSAADKTKLDGIATGANAYSLPTASSSTLGGIKVGSGLSISNGVLSSSGGSAAVSAYKIPYATCSTATSTAAKVATITNGVSFSLVAGAVCIINFSNNLNANNIRSPITVNVNSTGAKYIAGYTATYQTFTISGYVSNTNMSSYYYPQYKIINPVVFVYNGTNYTIISEVLSTNSYGDYNDG